MCHDFGKDTGPDHQGLRGCDKEFGFIISEHWVATHNIEHPDTFEFQIKNNNLVQVCSKYCMGHTYTENLFVAYLKFKFNLASCFCVFFKLSLTTLIDRLLKGFQ